MWPDPQPAPHSPALPGAPAAPASPDADPAHPSWAAFRVDDELEAEGLLEQLRRDATPLVLTAPSGGALVGQVCGLDRLNARINLSVEDHHPQLQQLVDADEAIALGYLQNIKLQFDLQDLVLVRGAKASTLQAAWPQALYRFQRRGAFRVRTLDRQAPTATLRHPAIPDMRLTLRVIDISIGGCALQMPADVPALEPGVRLHGVQVDLGGETRFGGTLQIQHLVALNGEGQALRVGCEWLGLAPEAQRALQRYIDQTQKRRRLLALD
jgi:flagellar brake protein